MKTKLTLATVALIALPAFASAMCSDQSHQAMSCAEGMTWDAATQSCTKQVNS